MAEARRSSILKPPKQRAPLQEVSSLNVHHHDDFTATTVTQTNIMRRVSFAGVSTVKEFDTRAESVLVCHTPAYEESFATSDSSSVPSEHSSRFLSRSTIFSGDQSTLPPATDGASAYPEDRGAGRTQSQNLDLDDMIFKEFGVQSISQRTKSPPRRTRFSLAVASDEDSPAPKEVPKDAPVLAFSSSSFYGTASPKPRPSAIPSPRSVRLAIDPFTLRPTRIGSPKSQSKATNSPKSQSKLVNSPKSQSKLVNSPKSQSKLVNSPKSQSKLVNSPKSQSKLVNSPKSQSRRKSLIPDAPPSKSKCPLAKALFEPNESAASSEMELPEPSSRNLYVETPSPSSTGLAVTPFRSANRTAVGNDDMELTQVQPCTPGWKNKTVYDDGMDFTKAIPTRIHSADDTRVQFSDGQVHCNVQNSMTMEFSRPVSSIAITNEQHFVSGVRDENRGVACVSRSHVTALPVAAPIANERAQQVAVSLSGDPDSVAGQAVLQRSLNRTGQGCLAMPSNTSVCDAVDMDFTEAQPCVPVASRTLNTTVGMEFTKVIPSVPVSANVRFAPPLNSTVYDPQGMEFTQVIPVSNKEFEPVQTNDLNHTLNESVGMDFTEAIPSLPIVQDVGFSGPLPSVSHEATTSNKTLNESMGMDFTEAVPAAQDFARSFRSVLPNQTLSDSVAMEFTKAVPCAPIQDNRLCEPVPEPFQACTSALNRTDPSYGRHTAEAVSSAPAAQDESNQTLSDSVAVEFTKAVPCAPILQENRLYVEDPCEPVPDSLQPCNSTLNRTDPSCIRTTTESLSNQANTNTADSSDQVSHTPLPDGTKTPDSATVQPVPSREVDTIASLQPALDSSQQTGNLALPINGIKLPVQVCDGASAISVDSTSPEACAPAVLLETPIIPRLSERLTPPPKLQLSRKRSHDEVENTKQDELVSRRSRLMTSLVVPPTDIVIPSSRSPTPDKDDSATRFPGLCQSFSSLKPTSSNMCPEPNTTPVLSVPESEVNPVAECQDMKVCASVNEPISTDVPVELETPPINEAAPSLAETDTPISVASEDMLRGFLTPDEYNFTDISDKTKSTSPEKLLHKSIMDISIPSIADISDACTDRDLSSHARLCATILEVEKNVAVFHPEPEVEVALNELMRCEAEEAEKCAGEEGNKSVCGEQREELRKNSVVEPESNDALLTVLPNDSPREPVSNGALLTVLPNDSPREPVSNGALLTVLPNDSPREPESNGALLTVLPNDSPREPESNGALLTVLPNDSPREPVSNGALLTVLPNDSPREPESNGALLTVLPNDSPRMTEARVSVLSHSTRTDLETSRMAFGVSRPLKEVFKEHRSLYRERARCNWTVRKLKDDEFCFNFLKDSVELRIEVKESRCGGASGRDGQFISLVNDNLHGVWYIGGRLLYQRLSTHEWNSRIQQTANVLKVVEDANLVANDVEVFMTHLAHLKLLQNIRITQDWICFDVLSQKTKDRWFKVKVDCRDLLNIKPQHVTVENIIGETREADIQNLVTCVKRDSSFLKNYVEVVKEYLQTIERVL